VTHTEAGSDRPESGVCVTRLVITAWLPVPPYELRSLISLAAGFHASLTVWFGADLVSGGLGEGGPLLTTVKRGGCREPGRGSSPHHTKDVNDLGQNLPGPTV
jgi:hypothetical protein